MTYILCNRCVSLTDFEGLLMGLILHKGHRLIRAIAYQWLKLVAFWYQCDNIKITWIKFNSNTVYILFYKRCIWWKHVMGLDSSWWISPVEWVEEKASQSHTQQVPLGQPFPLLTFVHFRYFSYLLGLCIWLVSIDVDPVLFVFDLHMWSLLSYDNNPICKKCYTLGDDSERPWIMSFTYYPKFLPLMFCGPTSPTLYHSTTSPYDIDNHSSGPPVIIGCHSWSPISAYQQSFFSSSPVLINNYLSGPTSVCWKWFVCYPPPYICAYWQSSIITSQIKLHD